MRLNVKQKILFERLFLNKNKISCFVENLASELNCSEGCLWGNLRELKKLGLAEDNRVSDLGALVLSEMKGGGKNG